MRDDGHYSNKPYGENFTGGNSDGFATYYQDSSTQLHYADQRYYAGIYGRFNTPDRYMASGGPPDPSSWNRFSYVGNDPVGFTDPTGTIRNDPDDGDANLGTACGVEGSTGAACAPIEPLAGIDAADITGKWTGSLLYEGNTLSWDFASLGLGSASLSADPGMIRVSLGDSPFIGFLLDCGCAPIDWPTIDLTYGLRQNLFIEITALAQLMVKYKAWRAKSTECDKEWADASQYCSDPNIRKNYPGIWGGSFSACVKGQVSQACGGNKVK
jgi:RHS repeat-associated protein